jgi:hypothetical protein
MNARDAPLFKALAILLWAFGARRLFYLVDCFWASQEHPDIPFLRSGIYAGGLFGFLATGACVVGAFLSLIIGKTNETDRTT